MIKIPKLNFNYNDFEPYIDSKTMEIHYNKHHFSYINNINKIFKEINFYKNDSSINLIKNLDQFPNKYKNYIKNNLGGHVNHSLFWKFLGHNNNIPNNIILIINKFFKNFELFKYEFEKCGLDHFGSGWVWLIYNKKNKLSILSTSNQDNPIMGYKFSKVSYGYPILGLDLWEHAYYLKYQNNKIDYIKSFWNIINWNYVNKMLIKAQENI